MKIQSWSFSAYVRVALAWLLLGAVALAAQDTIASHQARVQGRAVGFPAPVTGTEVPMMGVNAALEQYDEQALTATLDRLSAGGFTWVRQPFYWRQVERAPGQFDWHAADRILAAMAHHPDLRLIAVLDDANGQPPADPADFAAFAGAFAARYGAHVDHYQIWDEPNLASHWGGGPVSPPAYADLLARAARAIRAADPGARILLAGLAPTTETGPRNLSDVRYLEQLYQAGAAPHFDVVVGKPYGFYTGPYDRRVDERVLNFSRLILLRRVMVAQGDADRAIWASHFGWHAPPVGWRGIPSVWGQTDEATQAAWTVGALSRAREEWPWCGPLILAHFQPAVAADDARWGFALVWQDGSPRPVYERVSEWALGLPDAAPPGGYAAQNDWATYQGDWQTGPLGADVGADGDRASFRFDGPSAALTVRRGPYRAFLYVTIDGEPANALPKDEEGRAYVVLYDDGPSLATVPLATGLSPGVHTVEVVAQGGQHQWVVVDWRVGSEPVRDAFGWKIGGLIAAGLALVVGLMRDLRRVSWAELRGAFLAWSAAAQVALMVGLIVLLWIAAAVSWGRDWSSPWLVVSALVLPALAALFSARSDLALALVAFTAPLYRQPSDLIYRALSVPEVLVALCAIGVLIRRDKRPRRRRAFTALDGAVALLCLAAAVAAIGSRDLWAALFDLRTVFLFPAIYYALIRSADLTREGRWRLMDGLVWGGVVVALIGLIQYVLGINLAPAEGGLLRLQSVYYSPNNVGLYLGRVWPLLLAVVVWGERGRRRALYALALLPVALALLLSFSRGALLLGVPAALLTMGWWVGGRWRWLSIGLVVLILLGAVLLLRVPRLASLLDLEQGSTFFRLQLWRSSLAMMRQHPWLGVGPGNFKQAYRTRYVLPSAWQEFNLEHPHNVYLDHWTRLGVLGVLAGLAIQILFVRQMVAKRRNRPSAGRASSLATGLLGSMAVFWAHGLVDNALFFPDLALAFFLTLAVVQSAFAERGRPAP